MAEVTESSYDAIPYDGRAFAETHPDHLATLAALHGLESPATDGCRVLEIGCGDGGNLAPMAESLPESSFLGIDLGETHIERARQFASDVGLTNVEFRQQDIAELGAEEGTFDYIICHGVYSWVPGGVQKRIFDICFRQMTPNGVAFISFNTLPGWHLKRMIRDVTAYHCADVTDPQKRLEESAESRQPDRRGSGRPFKMPMARSYAWNLSGPAIRPITTSFTSSWRSTTSHSTSISF